MPCSCYAPLGLGLLLTLAQVGVAMALSGQANLYDAYVSLYQWDSVWFGSVVDDGYQCDLAKIDTPGHMANVCFFPAFLCLLRP